MPPPTLFHLQDVFTSIVTVAISLGGIATLVMILVGGFQYLSAGGDKDATQKASRTLTYAIGGLVLLLAGGVIMNLLGNFLGIDLGIFNICLPGNTPGVGPCS